MWWHLVLHKRPYPKPVMSARSMLHRHGAVLGPGGVREARLRLGTRSSPSMRSRCAQDLVGFPAHAHEMMITNRRGPAGCGRGIEPPLSTRAFAETAMAISVLAAAPTHLQAMAKESPRRLGARLEATGYEIRNVLTSGATPRSSPSPLPQDGGNRPSPGRARRGSCRRRRRSSTISFGRTIFPRKRECPGSAHRNRSWILPGLRLACARRFECSCRPPGVFGSLPASTWNSVTKLIVIVQVFERREGEHALRPGSRQPVGRAGR